MDSDGILLQGKLTKVNRFNMSQLRYFVLYNGGKLDWFEIGKK